MKAATLSVSLAQIVELCQFNYQLEAGSFNFQIV